MGGRVGSSARCELALKADGKAGGEQGVLELARSGDDSAFGALVGPYRAELLAQPDWDGSFAAADFAGFGLPAELPA